MQPLGIFVDSHESPYIKSIDWGPIPSAISTLEHSDLWATMFDGSLIAFERKTPGDLLSSIADKRLFNECNRMRQYTPFCYLVITGLITYDDKGSVIIPRRQTQWNIQSVQGALTSVEADGVKVINCVGDDAYRTTVLKLISMEHNPSTIIEPLRTARNTTPQEQVLMSMAHGIGQQKATDILSKFNNDVSSALCWLTRTNDMQAIPGIGPKTKKAVRKRLNLTGNDEFCIMDSENYINYITGAINANQS